METVTTLGRETAYVRWDRGGDGPGLLCVHGSGGVHAVWSGQQRLADRYPVTALDLSGHGDSEDVFATPGYTTLSAYADDVLSVAAATDSRILIGNSLGGAIVLHIALERDFEPDAIVLTGTSARMGVLEDLLQWFETDFERAISFLHDDNGLFYADSGLRERSAETMRTCGQAVVSRDFQTCHEFDIRSRLEEIDVPTLVVAGEHDKLTPPGYQEQLAEGIPGAQFVSIPEAGHLPQCERPGAFNEAVASFLDSVSSV